MVSLTRHQADKGFPLCLYCSTIFFFEFPAEHKYFRYEIQRSGPIPTQRLAWRSDSCKVCHADNGADLSGAWYEAANTMKWGLRKYKKKLFLYIEEREKVNAGLPLYETLTYSPPRHSLGLDSNPIGLQRVMVQRHLGSWK